MTLSEAEGKADAVVPVDARPFGEFRLGRRPFVEDLPFEDGRPLLAGADGDERLPPPFAHPWGEFGEHGRALMFNAA